MKLFNDLPAHVLFVHAPVVLVPLVAVAALVLALRAPWRWRWGWVLLIGVTVALVVTILAYESGQEFGAIIEGSGVDFSTHESFAGTARVWVFLWFLATAAMVAVDRFGLPMSGQVTVYARATLVALMIATAALSVVWIFRTGEEGACITWGPTVGTTC